jgi:hypothetical protein
MAVDAVNNTLSAAQQVLSRISASNRLTKQQTSVHDGHSGNGGLPTPATSQPLNQPSTAHQINASAPSVLSSRVLDALTNIQTKTALQASQAATTAAAIAANATVTKNQQNLAEITKSILQQATFAAGKPTEP